METDTTDVGATGRSDHEIAGPRHLAPSDLSTRTLTGTGASHGADTGGAYQRGAREIAWRTRSFRGAGLSEGRLASMSGPLILVLVGGLYLLGAVSVDGRAGLSVRAAGFWPPAGVALAAMLVLPVRRWGWVVLAISVATAVGVVLWNVPPVAAGWWGAANVIEPALAALVLRAVRSSRWLPPGRLLVVFLATAVIGAPAVAGAIGGFGTAMGYDRPWSTVWVEWIVADGLGVLVTVPLLVTYTARERVRRTGGETIVLALLVLTAIGLTFADLGDDWTALLAYLLLVLLIFAGMRFGTWVAAAVGLVVGLSANAAFSMGYGPFGASDGQADAVTLQIYLAIALVTSFVVAAMASDLADRNEVNRLLSVQATHDGLTGLPNRALFAERLRAALPMSREVDRSVAVLLLDLDDFKKINDRHGHAVGDEVLVVLVDRLRDKVRPGDVLYRLGGDEFVVLCEDRTEPGETPLIAEHLLRGLDGPVEVGGLRFHLTASIGIATVHGSERTTASDLLRRADIALHHGKRTAGTHITLFDRQLEADTRRQAELGEELHGAIERGELSVHYQPVVDLATGCVTSVEALLRWTSRRFGPVGSDEFIPIAEMSGLISVIGDWVLVTACRQVAWWRAAEVAAGTGASNARVAVNVSARQVCDSAFPARVRRILDGLSVPPEALTLEITETAVMDDLEASAAALAELRHIGVRLSMDDFGTGYSSLTYLRRIPVDMLKIDRSFVAGLGASHEDTAIVESLINLGHSFGVQVVAEGIETADQLQRLIALGCDHGQGFLWSAAVDGRTAGLLLRRTPLDIDRIGVVSTVDTGPLGETAV